MTRDELESQLAFWRKQEQQARDEVNKARMRVRDSQNVIRLLEGQLAGGLRAVNKSGSFNNVTSDEHALATSQGRAKKSSSKLLPVANAAGKSLRDLARRTGYDVALISKAARGKIPIPSAIASQIAALTVSEQHPKGYEAIPENWRGGLS